MDPECNSQVIGKHKHSNINTHMTIAVARRRQSRPLRQFRRRRREPVNAAGTAAAVPARRRWRAVDGIVLLDGNTVTNSGAIAGGSSGIAIGNNNKDNAKTNKHAHKHK